MSKLHILQEQGRAAIIFQGMFGTASPGDKEGTVVFKLDPELAKCSSLLSGAIAQRNLVVPASSVVTIEADDDVINAIKANVARGLLSRWEAQYNAILGALGQGTVDHEGQDHVATLVAVPGMGSLSPSLLSQALQSEHTVARQNIERLISTLGVQPHWVDVQINGLYLRLKDEFSNDVVSDGNFEVTDSETGLNPVPMATWNKVREDYATTCNVEDTVDFRAGLYDVKGSLPVYLPKPRQGAVETMTRRVGSLFSFGGTSAKNRAPAQAPRPVATPAGAEVVASSVMEIIMQTPVLMDLVKSMTPVPNIDFNSRVLRETEMAQVDDYEDEYEDDDEADYDDEGNFYPRDRG